MDNIQNQLIKVAEQRESSMFSFFTEQNQVLILVDVYYFSFDYIDADELKNPMKNEK